MLIGGVLIGFVLGLLLRGRPGNLLDARIRWSGLLFLAVMVRYGTELAIANGVAIAETLRLPLFGGAFGLLLITLWHNRAVPGMLVVMVGVASNAFAVVVNGGWMPVWEPSLALVGFTTADLVPTFHVLLPLTLDAQFLRMAGPFGDLLPIPLPILPNVASIGDVFISLGLGWFVLATMIRGATAEPETIYPAPTVVEPVRLRRPIKAALSHTAIAPETGIPATPSYADALTLDRPTLLGGSSAGAMPVTTLRRGDDLDLSSIPPTALAAETAVPPIVARIGEHPYVRLATDARFVAFWLGQTISLLGDRLHQVALAVLVFGVTDSALATALVFLTAALPNLLIAPIAGTFVDRWDLRVTMVVSDLLRAALVLLIPVAAQREIALVFPLVFLITTISVFFRPAKAAAVPRIVRRDDLLAANSLTWTGETLADIAGYPIAGLFVAFLGTSIGLAFWLDAATYVVSAVLLLAITIPPVYRVAGKLAGNAIGRFIGELGDGWRFLRGKPSLYQNTLVSAVAQVSVGATIALTVVYARDVLSQQPVAFPTNYTLIEAAIGVGNLVGGLAVGAIGARFGKGHLFIVGLVAMGGLIAILGLTSNLGLALLASIGYGIANLVYVVPTQTLFAELTPPGMMGRVVAFRGSLVFGALTLAMALSGLMAEVIPAGIVIAIFGFVTLGAGVVAAFLPAIRRS
ncbi:MAG: MFS transporter [Candidatus Limnocylindrales bacterium]